MQITFENKRMIVTHPSGHVDSYAQQDLAEILAQIQKNRDNKLAAINQVNNYIQQATQS